MSLQKNNFDSEAFLAACAQFTTKSRQKLLKQLVKKTWFQATDPAVQLEIAKLPQTGTGNCDGFVEELVRRKEVIGDIVVRRMLSLPHGNFILCPVFEVQNINTQLIYTYEFAAYRYEVPTGAKGLVFVREHKAAEPTHFIILSGEKFATSESTYELMGGYSESEDKEITGGIIREIQEECGVKNLEIDEVILLGSLIVDPGLTSHETYLFVAYVSPSEVKRISAHAMNIDDRELNTYVHILPLTKLSDIIHDTTNALLLAAITKALANDLIPKQYCSMRPPSDQSLVRRTVIRTGTLD